MRDIFKNDRYLSNINIGSLKLLSLDIFDTLLFRSFFDPACLFEEVAYMTKTEELYGNYLKPSTFKCLRVAAERKARKKTSYGEVTLEEIYDEIPEFCCTDKQRLMNLEIEVEVNSCYLNPSVYSFMEHCKEKSIDIILVSDMYLGEDVIRKMLSKAGFDFSLISKIYVSSDHKVNKASGKLFEVVLRDNPTLDPETQILHIGDNIIGDYTTPKQLKIQSIHYNLDSNSLMSDIFYREKLFAGSPILGSLTSVRKLSAHLGNDRDVYWQIGSLVIAPLLTIACEWVLDYCVKHGISRIYPLMREGQILNELLQMSIARKYLNITSTPLYVSRKSTFLPSLDINAPIEHMTQKKNITIGDFLEMLNLKCYEDELSDILEIKLRDYDGDQLKKYLARQDVQKQLSDIVQNERKKILDYLDKLDFNTPYITFDIGYQGTIGHQLNVILADAYGSDAVAHFVIFGEEQIIDKILESTPLQSLCDIGIYDVFFKMLLEVCIMPAEGSTMSYDSGEPVLGKIIVSPEQAECVQKLHEGIRFFHQLVLETGVDNVNVVEKHTEELVTLIDRLFRLPTFQEAKALSFFELDFNFGDKTKNRLVSVAKEGSGVGSECWSYGAVTLANPHHLLKKIILDKPQRGYENKILEIAEKLLSDGYREVVVYGAGIAGRSCAKMFEVFDIHVVCFTDGNTLLHGDSIDGIEILSPPNAVGKYNNYPFVIGSFSSAQSICKTINVLFEEIDKEPILYYSMED